MLEKHTYVALSLALLGFVACGDGTSQPDPGSPPKVPLDPHDDPIKPSPPSSPVDPLPASPVNPICVDGQAPDPSAVECEVSAVTLDGAEQLWVVSRGDRPTDSGTLLVQEAGWYHLYNTHLAESGATQVNESVYFRVPTSDNLEGYPLCTNCEREWIVKDHDNDGSSDAPKYIGTFWLQAGQNTIEMHHYCGLFRAGRCVSFAFTPSSGQTCEASPNSVHFEADSICATPSTGQQAPIL